MTGARSLSAHIGYLFADRRLEERFAAARAAGFDAVEHPAPFELSPERARALLDALGLTLAQISSGTGGPGEKGLASLPGREQAFRDGYARALDWAEAAGCPLVHAMAGVQGDPATYRRNLDAALRLCEGRRPRLLVEAISAAAVPGYHMAHISDLLKLAQDLPGVRLLVDSFHAATDGHDPAAAIRAAREALGHVHIADHPGRGQPGTGALNFAGIVAALDETGYAGAIGFEYVPDGADHLTWLPTWPAAG